MLTPPLAALRNLQLFSISEEFTTFQHIRPGVGWVGVGWDVNVHLHLHTWMLRCCYVGHGLGWCGMLTFICTCTPRGCYVAATWGMGWGGIGFTAGCGAATVKEMCGQPCQLCFTETEIAASQLPKRPAPLTAAWPSSLWTNVHIPSPSHLRSFQLMLSRMTPFAFMRPARSWRSAKVVATEV